MDKWINWALMPPPPPPYTPTPTPTSTPPPLDCTCPIPIAHHPFWGISQMQAHLAACRELAGDYNGLLKVLYVFELKM